MEQIGETISVSRESMEAIERRCVLLNVALNRLRSALERGDQGRVLNLLEEAREANWTNRRDLLAAGVPDSILADKPLSASPPDDDDLLDTDLLDLSDLPPPRP
jgi:hypothetical protein